MYSINTILQLHFDNMPSGHHHQAQHSHLATLFRVLRAHAQYHIGIGVGAQEIALQDAAVGELNAKRPIQPRLEFRPSGRDGFIVSGVRFLCVETICDLIDFCIWMDW